ncbi:transcription antitermination factor NusB [Suttonella sp. R2A3]|uniref:transcription antitermination factor NusB n=1 Tax=Suttonella sp. R2A3 TaxID=2908648 RepID=UPI001F3B51B5|nr:transcription antitermination factor NusB [Suttonella sp. R2A3]UJF25382.1 transcription antitermination factor NusB [Suttonella sp. R2A3]
MSNPPNLKRQAIEQRSRARRLLVQTLYQWQISGGDAKETYHNRLIDPRNGDIDALYFDAAYEYISTQYEVLEESYAAFMSRQPKMLDPTERAILWIGGYELQHCPDIHSSVSINEAIELAKQFGAEDSYKFINATLDKLSKSLA